MFEKKKIRVDIEEFSIEYGIDFVIEKLNQAKKDYLAEFEDLELRKKQNRFDEGESIYLSGVRLENDEEYAKRLKQEENSQKWKREQYENLKKEFEGNKK